ncbi:neutral zinc metallopeptidase [Cryobacterium adonitolivorans]|uniref:Neutral zinc metallopeptidase n=1 Tax=Cryobacterium adonitolivorans TaxID=1259189 RepID=A0A4R8WB11_9MICO|nr:neutral zinc metallopeptidase [Cryobacterium adonitolivorans]TFC03157.1 neutral zinc metallopeptidase [Cryobacterium adonitolivorans]
MTFNDDAKYSGKGVRKSGRRTGLAVGGGGLGLVAIVLLSQLLGVDLSGLMGGGTDPSGQDETTALTNCLTGEDANTDVECRVGLTRDSLEDYWAEQAPAMGISYSSPIIQLFSGGVDTGCGAATSAVGPFYCPADQQIYLDTAFYDTLRTEFGATAGPLSQLYVVGHEWGHHVQNRAGTFASTDTSQAGPTSDAVRVEVQADCFAGAWLGSAAQTTDAEGTRLLEPITEAQIADALNAASAIGDDRIQEKTQGQVNPETWTHGSSEMRQRWFQAGYTNGAEACDTFAVADAEL